MLGITGIVLYLFIFSAKVIENAVGTLRLILVANGKKGLGAFLQFIIVIIWLFVAGLVLDGIMEDPIRIFIYAFGTAVGSYLGGWVEERLALGENVVMAITDFKNGDALAENLRKKDFAVTEIEGEGKEKKKKILMIVSRRKNKLTIMKIIKRFDKTAMVLVEPAADVHGGFLKQ